MLHPLTVGGGVRTAQDVRNLLLAGADKVSFNSAAVANPDVVAEAADQFGSQCIVVAIDAKTVSPCKWEIFTHGGRKPTGIDALEFARTVTAKGAGEILLTSMDRDGTRAGFNLPLTRAISDAVDVPVIASGGVGELDHLVDGVTQGGASAVLAASIFHFGDYTIREAKEHMAAAGIPDEAGMTDWQSIAVTEGDVEQTLCDCCRTTTTRASGDLSNATEFLGWYDVTFGRDFTRHPPLLRIYVGDWSENGSSDTRWGMRVFWHSEGCELVDRNDEEKDEIDAFTPLGRDDILNTPFSHELWAMTDAIIMKDSRLQELHTE